MYKKKKSGNAKRKTDIVSLIISVVFGCIWCIVGGNLYKKVLHSLPTCVVMGIYFLGLAVTLCLGILVCNAVSGYRKPKSRDYKMTALSVAAIFVAAILFQLIYGIDINISRKNREVDAFVFLIDDSGSMGLNDPYDERYKSIKTVMNAADPDKRFVVYSFSAECKKVSEMIPAKDIDKLKIEDGVDNDDTQILKAINIVFDDIDNDVIDCGKGSRIILLTDGVSTELFDSIKFRNTLSRANDMGVSISAVGFGDCDDNYLQNMADMTGGKYVRASGASELGQAMLNVSKAVSDYNRDLINHRKPTKSFVEWIYGAERLIFIVLLGVVFIYIKSLLMRTNDTKSNLFLIQIVIVAIGAVGIEIGMNVLYLDEWFMRLVMCVSFCLVYLTTDSKAVPAVQQYEQFNEKHRFDIGSNPSNDSYDNQYDDRYDDLYN